MKRSYIAGVFNQALVGGIEMLRVTSLALGCMFSLSLPVLAAPARKPATKAAPAKKQPAEPSIDDHPLIKKLTALPSGPGVVICEPVCAGGDEALGYFGAGCGRWLHLMVGGQGEFGKTPLWTSVDHARANLKKPNLRLTLEDAARLPETLGITHAAVGEIRREGKITLAYHLYAVPSRKEIGTGFSVSGTEEAIVAGLPQVAREMAIALGAKSPSLPKQVGETVPELRRLGLLPWLSGDHFPSAMTGELRQLIQANFQDPLKRPKGLRPVLSLFWEAVHGGSVDYQLYVNTAEKVLADEYQNALICGEIRFQSYHCKGTSSGELDGAMRDLLKACPNNFLLHAAENYTLRKQKKLLEARAAGETAVRCARSSPDAWLLLSGTIADQAQAIRRARFINDLTPDELKQCEQFYAEGLPTALKAVSVAPAYVDAWRALSSSAAFIGEEELADTAMNKALALDAANYKNLWWGIQLYQPKWLDDHNKLVKVAKLAISNGDQLSSWERVELAIAIRHADLPDLAAKLVRTDEERNTLDRHFQNHKD